MRRGPSGLQWSRQRIVLPTPDHALRSPRDTNGMLVTPVGVCGIYPPRRSSVPGPRSVHKKHKNMHGRRFAWPKRWKFGSSICPQ